jgi:prepilin-type N-terminal cleavage/methylation domain-containing protein
MKERGTSMIPCRATAGRRDEEAGFTLVEVLTAMVILIFGLMAVTNLLLVAASSNTVANQSTAAAASASRIMDRLKDSSFPTLVAGGNVAADTGVTVPCGGEPSVPWPGPAPVAVNAPNALNNCDDDIPGVGKIHTRWAISAIPGTARSLFIQVRSEGTGALAGARSRAEFTTLRSCTEPAGCPAPP